MDLFAFTQIESLQAIAEKNGISVPRCRGYRLMKDEKPATPERIAKMIEWETLYLAERQIENDTPETGTVHEWCYRSEARVRRYMVLKKNDTGIERPVAIRWDRVHGKLRKKLKWAKRKARRRVLDQFALWNKYAGKENVLYIHARIGSMSWTEEDVKKSIALKPWFLDMVDDYFDTTYSDIYARIQKEEAVNGDEATENGQCFADR